MITCPSCNHQNEVGSSFCENCGHDLRTMAPTAPAPGMPPAGGGAACSNCGFSNIPGAAFCENCGNPLGQPMPPPQVKTATVPQPTPAPSGRSNGLPKLRPSECAGVRVLRELWERTRECTAACGPAAVPSAPPAAAPVICLNRLPVWWSALHPMWSFKPSGTPRFVRSCGMQLGEVQAAPPTYPPAAPVHTPAPVPTPVPSSAYVTGRLVIQPSGASIPIPPGKTEAMIGREDPVSGIFPEIDLDPHGGHDGGVGRKHARFFIQGSQLMIEDQDSVNGTLLNKQKLVAFPAPACHRWRRTALWQDRDDLPCQLTRRIPNRRCPACQTKARKTAVYCRICGLRLPPLKPQPQAVNGGSAVGEGAGESLCSSCGYKNMPGELFCAQCGVQIPPVASLPPSPPILLS